MTVPAKTTEFRQVQFTGAAGLKVVESDVQPLRDGEVLVKIHAVSLQYRDLMISKGFYPLKINEGIVPCSDGAGEIVAVSDRVRGFKVGDRVCANFSLEQTHGDVVEDIHRMSALGGGIDGCLTEVRAFPAYSLVHIPEHLSYEEAATLPCAGLTAYNCLFGPVPLKGGDTVLVEGSGGVSVFALQIAKANGANVIATTSSDEKGKVLCKLGANHVVNYKTNENWAQEVLKLTNGRGVDHVVEVAGAATLMQSISCTRLGGRIHLVGSVGKQQGGSQASLISALLSRNIHLRGVLIGPRVQFEALNRFISTTGLKPVIDKVFLFEEYPKALEYLESQKHVGKIVVKVGKQ